MSAAIERIGARGVLCALALAASAALAEPNAVISESQIKAAFLYNFTKFVEWPDGTFADKSDPITIGVLADDALAGELELIVTDRKVNGRAIVVETIETAEELAPLEMLFVSEAAEAEFAGLQEHMLGKPLLTVGESPAFEAAGGAICFLEQDGKLRFEINISAAQQANLKISAELQKLAIAVKRGR